MVRISAEPVRLGALEDGDGRLIYADGDLVAVLVRLSSLHGPMAGHWFLEAGFGCVGGPNHPTFVDLDAAHAWIGGRLPAAA